MHVRSLLFLALCACAPSEREQRGPALLTPSAPASDEPADLVPELVEPLALAPDLLEKLRQADRVDGAEDGMVESCTLCGLKMRGEDDIASAFGEHVFLHCNEGCRELFDSDPEHWLRWVTIPH